MAPLFRSNKCQHDPIQQFIVTMNFEMLNRPYGESMADHRIPFSKQKDLRLIIFKVIAEFAPFAAAVREIFVDCGDYFFTPLALGFQLELHGMKLTLSNPQFCQHVLRFGKSSFRDFNNQLMPQRFQRGTLKALCAALRQAEILRGFRKRVGLAVCEAKTILNIDILLLSVFPLRKRLSELSVSPIAAARSD